MRILQQRLQLRWLTLNSEKDNEEPLQKCRGFFCCIGYFVPYTTKILREDRETIFCNLRLIYRQESNP